MKFLRDPLVHFLAAGAILAGAFALADRDGAPAADEIVVSAGQIASMRAIFARTWQRPPTGEEMEGLVAEHIRDEVLYREAVSMGLDQDDPVVRRRLRQKMEFVADAMAEAEPTDAELRAYVAEHPDWFRAEPRYSFTHVFFRSGGEASPEEAEQLKLALEEGTAHAEELGDAFMPGSAFDDVARRDIVGTFGEDFAASLADAPLDQWAGPIASAFGEHLVHVSARTEATTPPFAEIRDAARREWLNERRIEAADALYERLRARYTVRVEEIATEASGPALAEAAQ